MLLNTDKLIKPIFLVFLASRRIAKMTTKSINWSLCDPIYFYIHL